MIEPAVVHCPHRRSQAMKRFSKGEGRELLVDRRRSRAKDLAVAGTPIAEIAISAGGWIDCRQGFSSS
jgi:hypothetical protein